MTVNVTTHYAIIRQIKVYYKNGWVNREINKKENNESIFTQKFDYFRLSGW